MKKFILVLALLFTTYTYADEPGDTYIGVQFGQSTLEVETLDDIETTYGLVRLGIYVTESFAVDLRYGNGLEDDTLSGVDYSIDRIAGLYAVYHFELSSETSIYGLVGYTEIDLKAESNSGSIVEEEDDISYGFGLDFGNINIEFTQYKDHSKFDASALSIGYTYYF